jgi:hypothetical protein
MPRAMLTAVIAVLGLYLAFVALVFLGQPRLLYLPDAAGRALAATRRPSGSPMRTCTCGPRMGSPCMAGWYLPRRKPAAT